MTRWASHVGVELAEFANLQAFQKRVADRPGVQEAMKAESLNKN